MKTSLAAGLMAAALCLSAATAVAHSFLIDASPSAKDHVAASPKVVKLRFGGGVEAAYSTISILDSTGKVVVEGAKGQPEKPRELTLEAPDLVAGNYTVKFRVLSSDGHIVEGKYEFTVDPH
jgi:methionine-rich copper-binding protein CopC